MLYINNISKIKYLYTIYTIYQYIIIYVKIHYFTKWQSSSFKDKNIKRASALPALA